MTCTAQGGPRLIISWYRGNQLVLSGLIGDTDLNYSIQNASVVDNGEYTCVANIDSHQVNSSFINVLGKI